jgi:hypothetical protein
LDVTFHECLKNITQKMNISRSVQNGDLRRTVSDCRFCTEHKYFLDFIVDLIA